MANKTAWVPIPQQYDEKHEKLDDFYIFKQNAEADAVLIRPLNRKDYKDYRLYVRVGDKAFVLLWGQLRRFIILGLMAYDTPDTWHTTHEDGDEMILITLSVEEKKLAAEFPRLTESTIAIPYDNPIFTSIFTRFG